MPRKRPKLKPAYQYAKSGRKAHTLTPAEKRLIVRGRALREQGMTWKAMGEKLKAKASWLRYRIDDDYREWKNRRREYEKKYGIRHIKVDNSWMEQLALIPPDTRDFTGRLMGDPIPGDPRREQAFGDQVG